MIRRIAFQEWGGTETVVYNTAKQMAYNKHQVKVLSTNALSSQKIDHADMFDIERFDYFYPLFPMTHEKVLRLDKKGGSPYSFRLLKYLQDDRNCDIVHCHSMGRMASTSIKICQKKKIPFVLSFHGGCYSIPKEEQKSLAPPSKTLNYGRFLDLLFSNKNYIRDSNGIITLSQEEYRLTCDKFPNKEVTYIPNGINYDFFQRDFFDFKEKYNIPVNRKMITCISRIDPQKNQKILIRVLDSLIQKGEHVHLLLAGPTTSKQYLKEIKEEVHQYKLESFVTIVHDIAPESTELLSAYKSSDVFILPSIHEPFGIVILEAWASKIPVLASKVGGMKDLIQNRKNGFLFDPNSIHEILKCYDILSKNQNIRNAIVENSHEDVKNNFSWEKISQKTLDFYTYLIGQKRN